MKFKKEYQRINDNPSHQISFEDLPMELVFKILSSIPEERANLARVNKHFHQILEHSPSKSGMTYGELFKPLREYQAKKNKIEEIENQISKDKETKFTAEYVCLVSAFALYLSCLSTSPFAVVGALGKISGSAWAASFFNVGVPCCLSTTGISGSTFFTSWQVDKHMGGKINEEKKDLELLKLETIKAPVPHKMF